jgi:hypothetical protein
MNFTLRHSHAVEIYAWADGAQIQMKDPDTGAWVDNPHPLWCLEHEYRIKPTEPIVCDKRVEVPLSVWEAVTDALDRLSLDCEYVLRDAGNLNVKIVYECRDLVTLINRVNRRVESVPDPWQVEVNK